MMVKHLLGMELKLIFNSDHSDHDDEGGDDDDDDDDDIDDNNDDDADDADHKKQEVLLKRALQCANWPQLTLL